jgi:chaperone modulatory protein CbpM
LNVLRTHAHHPHARIEHLARLHYDLDINLEGLEAISHLLDRMDASQQEARVLRERLRVYEEEG